MTLAESLKNERKKSGLSQKEFADKLGMNARTYASYERGERDISTAVLLNICKTLNISSDVLLGNDTDNTSNSDLSALMQKYDNIKPIKLKRFPMLGEIACGAPIFADEDKEHYIMADMDIDADFCLTAKGDSMIGARIYNGDIVFIKEMPIVENGDIAAVIIEEEATLKRVYYYPDKGKLVLNPENPAYEPLVYIGDELNYIRILGKAVYFMSPVQ
ncbi:MAG: helix-turn-helix domain-containing protein [Ruminococcus sp.]|nr:helix-turn-helix domain-containing protein [Ruminococcus sp.]